MAEAVSVREVQGADGCRRNKAPDPERPGGDEITKKLTLLLFVSE